MSISITEDLVASSKFTVGVRGGKAVRMFHVSGTSGGRTGVYEAATATGIPRWGDPHPDIPGLFCADVTAEPLGKNHKTNQLVTVNYVSPEAAQGGTQNTVTIEISGSNGLKTVSRWPDGNLKGELIVVPYSTNPSSFVVPVDPKSLTGNAVDPAKNGGNYYSYAKLQVLSPNTVITFTRREQNSPISAALQYRRRINSKTWNGGAKGTWLCREVNGQAITGSGAATARTWETRYQFEYDPDGWSQIEYFRDTRTGTIPPGVSILKGGNNGWIQINPYAYIDFNALRLPAIT